MCDNKWRFNLRVSRFFPSFREVCEFFSSLCEKAQEGESHKSQKEELENERIKNVYDRSILNRRGGWTHLVLLVHLFFL
jgi:alpha-tubulin suppressor-like RCC1 family protein